EGVYDGALRPIARHELSQQAAPRDDHDRRGVERIRDAARRACDLFAGIDGFALVEEPEPRLPLDALGDPVQDLHAAHGIFAARRFAAPRDGFRLPVDAVRDDLDVAAALPLLVLPRVSTDIALDCDAAPFRQVLRAKLALPVPCGDAYEVRTPVFGVPVHGDEELRDLLFARLAHFHVGREVADHADVVHRILLLSVTAT